MDVRDFRIALKARKDLDYNQSVFISSDSLDAIYQQAKELAYIHNQKIKESASSEYLSAPKLNATALIHMLYQEIVSFYVETKNHLFFSRLILTLSKERSNIDTLTLYSQQFPSILLNSLKPTAPFLMEESLRGYFVHQVMLENKALVKAAKPFVDPQGLSLSLDLKNGVEQYCVESPPVDEQSDLFSFLIAPAKAHPNSLSDQIEYMLVNWKEYLSENLKNSLLRAIDFIKEESKVRFPTGPSAPTETLSYSLDKEIEYEGYSTDSNWMPHVVMIAKSTLVWLDQLSKKYNYPITRLDQIPDKELDLLAQMGFTSLWLIGLWERSTASKKIKNLMGNLEAEASAYSLKGYEIAPTIGGWEALKNLDYRCRERGIRLASDMVPNHTGLDSDWVLHHPQRFIRTAYPPFPSYTYNGSNLSSDENYDIKIEDHYYDRSDAAVTFRVINKQTNETNYIFHGNDGTSMPWNDTAQLDFLNSETREAVIQQILHVARNFHIIRFDAAMTLAKRHIQRLWYPPAGSGGDIPGRANYGLSETEFSQKLPTEFWREVVDRVAIEVPDTLLLAEAFWMMEGYFVRTLGMHRVYNSAFMNMLKNEENKKYRDTVKNTLAFDPEILKRFVNFMNNPDEETAIAQFGNGDKYFGVCTLLATMPGLPMFGHGQIEGFHEKYGMEYSRSYWNEYPDSNLVKEHYRRIFPLLRMRHIFSGSEYFDLFDVWDNSSVSESIFAYVNGNEKTKALILYNNQYETAQGKIYDSTAKVVKLDGENSITVKKSLAESLGLNREKNRFVLYESFPDGLTYIIPSMVVFDDGYWAHLAGYEVKAFLNIREIVDEDGVYAKLYQNLGGNGTASLERDLAKIRIQPLHKAMDNFSSQTMLNTLKSILRSEGATAKELRKFVLLTGEAYARIATLYEALSKSMLSKLPPLKSEVQPKDVLTQMENLIECFSKESVSLAFKSAALAMDELVYLLQTTLLLKQFVDKNSSLSEVAQTINTLLTEVLFASSSNTLSLSEREYAIHLRKAAFLVVENSTVREQLTCEKPSWKEALRSLLEEEEFRLAIGYNLYEGQQWYRKESYQETVFLIALGFCLKEVHNKQAIENMVTSLLKADLFSDYKVDMLLNYLN